jgi:Flp pilus assembly protein TadB
MDWLTITVIAAPYIVAAGGLLVWLWQRSARRQQQRLSEQWRAQREKELQEGKPPSPFSPF